MLLGENEPRSMHIDGVFIFVSVWCDQVYTVMPVLAEVLEMPVFAISTFVQVQRAVLWLRPRRIHHSNVLFGADNPVTISLPSRILEKAYSTLDATALLCVPRKFTEGACLTPPVTHLELVPDEETRRTLSSRITVRFSCFLLVSALGAGSLLAIDAEAVDLARRFNKCAVHIWIGVARDNNSS